MHENAYEISLRNGALAGPGAAFLLKATHGEQFVALGEAHNNKDISPITVALLRGLHET